MARHEIIGTLAYCSPVREVVTKNNTRMQLAECIIVPTGQSLQVGGPGVSIEVSGDGLNDLSSLTIGQTVRAIYTISGRITQNQDGTYRAYNSVRSVAIVPAAEPAPAPTQVQQAQGFAPQQQVPQQQAPFPPQFGGPAPR